MLRSKKGKKKGSGRKNILPAAYQTTLSMVFFNENNKGIAMSHFHKQVLVNFLLASLLRTDIEIKQEVKSVVLKLRNQFNK